MNGMCYQLKQVKGFIKSKDETLRNSVSAVM